MAESDRSSSVLNVENDSILSDSVYSLAKVGEGDASSVASLSLLLVGDTGIQPYCFDPEQEVDLEMSTSSESEEMLDNDGQEHLGNIIWYVTISVVTKFCGVCTSETSLPIRYTCGHCQPIPTARVCLLPRNRQNQSVVGWRSYSSVYYTTLGIF